MILGSVSTLWQVEDVKQQQGKAMQQAETAKQQAEVEGQIADQKQTIAAESVAQVVQEQAALHKVEATAGRARPSRVVLTD